MNIRTYSALIFVFLLVSLAIFPLTSAKEQDGHAVLLPESAAKDLNALCSRGAPKVEGTWKPSPEIIATMESHLDKIASMREKKGHQPLKLRTRDHPFASTSVSWPETSATFTSTAPVRSSIQIGLIICKMYVMEEAVFGAFCTTFGLANFPILR